MQVGSVYVHINQKIWPVACNVVFDVPPPNFHVYIFMGCIWAVQAYTYRGVSAHTSMSSIFFFPLSRLYIFNVVLMSGGGL